MTPWRWVRNLRPAGLIFYGAIGAFVLVVAGFPLLFPRGIQTGGPDLHEGLFVVSNGDWTHAHFESRALLEENERLRPQGQQSVGHVCFDASAVRPEIERALAKARRDRSGGRGIWLRAVATEHFGATGCIDPRGRRGRTYGTVYRAIAVREARPLTCSAMAFTLNNRRCPTLPRPPRPLHINDTASYPAEALARSAEGQVTIEALIGPKQELLECKPVTTSGDAALDRSACEVFAANIGHYAGKGSTAGLASGVRRIRARIRFELDRAPPPRSTLSPDG